MSRMLSVFLAAILTVCESALLEVESSTELVATLPFVRFALPELHEKLHGASFLQAPVKPAAASEAVPSQAAVPAVPAVQPPAKASEVATVASPAVQAQATTPAPAAAVPVAVPAAVAPQQVAPAGSPAQPPAAPPASLSQPQLVAGAEVPPQALVSHQQGTATATASKKMSPTTRVAATFSLALIVKVLCMMSNVACHVSPFPQVQQFHKLGDTGEADSAPLMSILYSGAQWVFYGNFAYCMTGKSGFLVLVWANITGAILGVYYVWAFQKNCQDQKALQQLHFYCRAAACVFSLQFLAIWSLSFSSALFFSGLMASLSSIISACSLCSTLPKVIKTQCSASINLELLLVGICSSVLWVSCGVMLWDVWILLPTLFGLVIQLACGFFVLLFPREEHGDLIHLPARSPICCWVLPRDGEQPEGAVARRALAGRAAIAAAQIRAALRAGEQAQDYGSTSAAGAGTGGTC